MGGNIESDVVIVLLVMIVSQIIIIPNALQCIGKTRMLAVCLLRHQKVKLLSPASHTLHAQ